MTEHQLYRGKDILEEISSLRAALSEANKNYLFHVDEKNCSWSSLADPFLSELNIRVRNEVVGEINSRIDALLKEFADL